MIIGYEASTAVGGGISSLLLAGRSSYDCIYVGSVWPGFTGKDATSLRTALSQRRDRIPWLDGDGRLRHASYKGLRELQDNAAVFDMAGRDA